MSSSNTIKILVAIITAAGVIIAALITGIFALLVEQTKTSANATSIAATYVAQRTVDAPLPQTTYTLPPTYTPLPTQPPYPTYTPFQTSTRPVVVVTPQPIVMTATPIPPIAKLAGQGYTRNGVTVTLRNPIRISSGGFSFDLIVENRSGRQLIVIWKNSYIHARDDKGTIYHQEHENETWWDLTKQFTISNNSVFVMENGCCGFEDNPEYLDSFVGKFTASTKYLIITIDSLAGLSNMIWRYDIQ